MWYQQNIKNIKNNLKATECFWSQTPSPSPPTMPFLSHMTTPICRKVDMPKLDTTIIWTLIFTWYVIKFRSRNWHQKDMCLEEFKLHAQNILEVLGSLLNTIGVFLWLLNEHENLHCANEWDALRSFKNHEANDYGHNLDSLIILH